MLWKKARNRSGMNINIKYQSRFLELDATGYLNYYSSAAQRANGPRADKQINIAGCTVEAGKFESNRYPFEIVDIENAAITFAAETREDAQSWVDMISAASRYHAKQAVDKGDEGERLDPTDIQGARKAFREQMNAAKSKASTAAETIARLAMTMHMESELLRTALSGYDFSYETETVSAFKNEIENKVNALQGKMLKQLKYNMQLQKTATVVYQRNLLKGWDYTGFLHKPDFKRSAVAQWKRDRGRLDYKKRWFMIDGTKLYYYKDGTKRVAVPSTAPRPPLAHRLLAYHP